MAAAWVERLRLTPNRISKEAFWSGAGLFGTAGVAGVVVCSSVGVLGPIGLGLFLFASPPGLWFLLGPWVVRHYANRLLALRWPPVLALAAWVAASLCMIVGIVWFLNPRLLGQPDWQELEAIIPPLFGWLFASVFWLAFTFVIGCLPSRHQREAPSAS